MTGILYTAFSSENREQKITHISITVQHCRLETETIEKTAQFAHEAYFPLAEVNTESKAVDKILQIACACSRLLHW